jgi:hypothetical protein
MVASGGYFVNVRYVPMEQLALRAKNPRAILERADEVIR